LGLGGGEVDEINMMPCGPFLPVCCSIWAFNCLLGHFPRAKLFFSGPT
jgi:hypothetical protein